MIKQEQIIFGCVFGSHLYGTNHEKSDKDFKWVFIPSRDDILLGNSNLVENHTKNGKNEDHEYIDLKKFVRMLVDGSPIALEMLFVPQDKILIKQPQFDYLIDHREEFLTDKMNGIIGYIRKHFRRYNVKFERLSMLLSVKQSLNKIIQDGGISPKQYLHECMDFLPTNEYCRWIKVQSSHATLNYYEILGRKYYCTISYFLECVDKLIDTYGSRTIKASSNSNNRDCKAIAHAIRSLLQLQELYTDRKITFPNKQKELLCDIIHDRVDFENEIVPFYEELMASIENLQETSTFNDCNDIERWDKWVADMYYNSITGQNMFYRENTLQSIRNFL